MSASSDISQLLENLSLTVPPEIVINLTSNNHDVLKYLKVETEQISRFNNFPLEYYGTIVKELAKGGYGIIFLTDKDYVLKVTINNDPETITRDVLTEIVYTKSLNHPGIIKYLDVYDSTQDSVREYMRGHVRPRASYDIMVMNKYDGSLLNIDVSRYIEKTKIIAFQIITSMAYLASRNIIHCDIKPDNIFIKQCTNKAKTVKTVETVIADFGIATDRECLVNINRKVNIVSLYFRPPEIALAYVEDRNINYNSKVDVWSTAAVIYKLYTGNYLFTPFWQGQSNTQQNKNLLELMFATLGPPQPEDGTLYNYFKQFPVTTNPRRLTDNDDLNDLLYSMLQYNPNNRISFSEAQVNKLFSNLQFNNSACYQGQIIPAIPCTNKTILFERNYNYNNLALSNVNNLNILTLWLLRIMYEKTDVLFKIDASKVYVLALEILYKFLTVRAASPSKLQLLGSACLYLAAVFLEVEIEPYEFDFFSNGVVTIAELINMVRIVLKTIDYDLLATTTWDYVNNQNLDYDVAITANKILMLTVPIIPVYMPQYKVDKTLARKCIDASILLENFKDMKIVDRAAALELLSEIKKFYTSKDDDIAELIMQEGWDKFDDIIEKIIN